MATRHFLLLLCCAGGVCGAPVLESIHIHASGKRIVCDFSFSNTKKPVKIPKFFQQFHSSANTYSINFLKTQSKVSEGIYYAPDVRAYFSKIKFSHTRRQKNGRARQFLTLMFVPKSKLAGHRFKASRKDGNTLRLFLGVKRRYFSPWMLNDQNAASMLSPNVSVAQDRIESASISGTRLDNKIRVKSASTFSVQPLPEKLVLIKDGVRMRKRASTKSPLVSKLAIGTEVKPVARDGNWYKVRSEGASGYIREDMLGSMDNPVQKPESDLENREKISERYPHSTNIKKAQQKPRVKKLAKQGVYNKPKMEKPQGAEREKRKNQIETERKRLAAEKKELERQKIEKARRTREMELAQIRLQKMKKLEEKIKLKKLKARRISYNSFGRRDPFLEVEQLSFSKGQMNLTEMKLVGIIWDRYQPLAIIEHRKESGISMALRVGDTVSNGKVAHISQTDVIFEISEFGVLRSYTMKLLPLEERTEP